jgi:hypothetical protein
MPQCPVAPQKSGGGWGATFGAPKPSYYHAQKLLITQHVKWIGIRWFDGIQVPIEFTALGDLGVLHLVTRLEQQLHHLLLTWELLIYRSSSWWPIWPKHMLSQKIHCCCICMVVRTKFYFFLEFCNSIQMGLDPNLTIKSPSKPKINGIFYPSPFASAILVLIIKSSECVGCMWILMHLLINSH